MPRYGPDIIKPGARYRAKVVGVTFLDGYPDNAHALRRELVLRGLRGEIGDHDYDEIPMASGMTVGWHEGDSLRPLDAELIRNPANEHDPNAVEVHAPPHGMLGHLSARVAAKLAPVLDAGAAVRAGICAVLYHPDNPDQPGVYVLFELQEEPQP